MAKDGRKWTFKFPSSPGHSMFLVELCQFRMAKQRESGYGCSKNWAGALKFWSDLRGMGGVCLAPDPWRLRSISVRCLCPWQLLWSDPSAPFGASAEEEVFSRMTHLTKASPGGWHGIQNKSISFSSLTAERAEVMWVRYKHLSKSHLMWFLFLAEAGGISNHSSWCEGCSTSPNQAWAACVRCGSCSTFVLNFSGW